MSAWNAALAKPGAPDLHRTDLPDVRRIYKSWTVDHQTALVADLMTATWGWAGSWRLVPCAAARAPVLEGRRLVRHAVRGLYLYWYRKLRRGKDAESRRLAEHEHAHDLVIGEGHSSVEPRASESDRRIRI